MHHLQLLHADSQQVAVSKLSLAATFWTRYRGLQFRRELPADEGLLITPCRSIHTHWMRFPIDVVMLDGEGTVIDVRSNLRPWRTCSGPSETRAILEVPATSANLKAGDRVAVRLAKGSTLPAAARWLPQAESAANFS